MLCPKCNSSMLKCIDSRPTNGLTRRRHVCIKCKERFSTFEIHMERYWNLKLKEELLNNLLTFSHETEEKLKEVSEDGRNG